MFCGSVTESLPTQVPHLSQRSYGLVNRGIYMLHQDLDKQCFSRNYIRIPW